MGLVNMKFIYHEIELTRRCNLKCLHCMRGDMQPIDIEEEYLAAFFSKTSHIHILTLTRGEVSIKPNLVETCAKLIKKFGAIVDMAGIVTNGKITTSRFFEACKKLESVVSKFVLEVSTSPYHSRISERNCLHLLKANAQFRAHPSDTLVIPVGRAKALPPHKVHKTSPRVNPYWLLNGWVVEPTYLNVFGQLISADTSYREQNNYIVCHVSEMSIQKFLDCKGFLVFPNTTGVNGGWSPKRIASVCIHGDPGQTVIHDKVMKKDALLSIIEHYRGV
jgi:hypothetical protein